MDYVFSVALTVTEFFALLFMADVFFVRRKLRLFQFLLLLMAMVALTVTLGMLAKNYTTIVRAPINILVLFVTLCVSHKGKISYKLFLSIAYYAGLSVVDYLVLALSILCFSLSYAEVINDAIMYLAGAFIAKTVLITAAYSLKRFVKKELTIRYASSSFIGLLLCVPCFSILSVLALVDTAVRTTTIGTWVFVIGVGLLICNLAMFFLWDKLDDANQLRMKNVLLEQQVKNRMEQVVMLESSYVKQRRLTHDFRNHACTLQGLLNAQAYEQATDYVQQWTKRPLPEAQVVHTNNHFVDIICNQKYEDAQQKGVSVSFLIEDLSEFPLKNDDLVTLLANAFDNAIEAAAACQTEKEIRVKIQQRAKKSWILSLRNTSRPVEIVADTVQTTNPDASEHGFGLQNMRHIVTQYHGECSLSYAQGWFQFTAIFAKTCRT